MSSRRFYSFQCSGNLLWLKAAVRNSSRSPMKFPRIQSAKAIDDSTLIVEFTNHEVKKYNISHLLDKPMFSPLRQSAFFKNFQIEQGGYSIT